MLVVERIVWWLLAAFGLWQIAAYLRERHRLKWLERLDPIKAWVAETGTKAAKQAGSKAQEKLVEVAGTLGVASIVGGVAALGIGSATLTLNADLRAAFIESVSPDRPVWVPDAEPVAPYVYDLKPGASLGPGPAGGVIVGGRSGRASGDSPCSYTAPNTPTIQTLTVVDTSTVWVEGPAFVGSCDDTHDSIYVAITRVAQDTTNIVAEVKGGAQVRDTVIDNTNLKADTTYTAYLKYRGGSSGLWSAWSAPDTFVNALSSELEDCGVAANGGPNEPAGLVPVIGRRFSSKPSSGSDRGTGSFPCKNGGSEGFDGGDVWNNSDYEVVLDATSPISPDSVYRLLYPARVVPGGSTETPGKFTTLPFTNASPHGSLSLDTMYTQFSFKLGTNYQVHSVGNKLYFHQVKNSNGPLVGIKGTVPIGGGRSEDECPCEFQWDLQGTQDAANSSKMNNTKVAHSLAVDTWYIVEILGIFNSAGSDQLTMWYREAGGTATKIFEATNLDLSPGDGTSAREWYRWYSDPTFGGQAGEIDPAFYLYFGNMYVSGEEN